MLTGGIEEADTVKYLPKVRHHVPWSCGWREPDLKTERDQIESRYQVGVSHGDGSE